MDIVDINKVLDDLEFTEEQHSKSTRNAAANENRSNKSQPDLYSSYRYGQPTTAAAAAAAAATATAVTPSPIPSPATVDVVPLPVSSIASVPPVLVPRIPKTNFVKVSNVFNSLNEYMNAGIEAVKITEESTSHHAAQINATSSMDALYSVPNTNLINNPNEQTGNYLYATESAVSSAGFPTQIHDGIGYIAATSASSYSNEIKFTDSTEQRISLDQRIDASSADLPSYEESQRLHESSHIVPESTESSIDNIEDGEMSVSSESVDGSSDVESIDDKIAGPETSTTLKTTNDSLDMRTELSSVVPPTSISEIFEITASHETDTALPDNVTMNGESSEIVVKENITSNQMDDEEEAVIKNVNECHDTEFNQIEQNNLHMDDNHAIDGTDIVPDVIQKPNDQFIKPIPITFETAATMDDVSDTELESYLQELEDLEDSSIGVKAKSDSMKSVNGSVQSDDIEACDVIENSGELQQCIARDDRNADSFSQASTVEFGEVNATSNINIDQNIETASALDVEPEIKNETELEHTPEATVEISENQPQLSIEPNHTQSETNIHTESASEMNVSVREQDREMSSEFEAPNECSECELDQHINNTAKRPNSLNLQNCTSTLIESPQNVASNSALNFSSDDNAGNTPPASGQFLSSSLSSDDSNIPDNNPMIHQLENSQGNMDSESANESNISENYSNSNQLSEGHLTNAANMSIHQIGKTAPHWVPDNVTNFCMQCNQKFSFIKRRHHCRACGLVLCSACCSLKAKLEYLGDVEARICIQCDMLLNQNSDSNRNVDGQHSNDGSPGMDGASVINSPYGEMPARSPNPNNPMEYCSIIPPHQQVTSSASAPISVMVPVGVLKREGVAPKSQRKEKNVMFSDGIRPGCDLTDLDNSWDVRPNSRNGELSSPSGQEPKQSSKSKINNNYKLPTLDPKTNSYIPPSTPTNSTPDSKLPPICVSTRTEFKYSEVSNNEQLIERLQTQQLKFMIQRNFYVLVKIINLTCCINKSVINFTTQGMHLVGQDEIVILLELDSSNQLPKDIFIHLNEIYRDADKGQAITELGFSMASTTPFLGSKEHGGFLFIRTTFQCMQNVIIPENPYLIGILIHRWEVPWAKIFPLRLMLRLGALHRYYPSPHVSVRGRNSVYAEIAQTIINFLADFRTYSYTIPTIRGMYIHMEDRRTNVLIPRNRYDQVMKALNNSSDHIFALAGNFSEMADGHLVCVQNTESGCAETHAYSTQAINIQGKPRKVTGASFLVLNGALKTTSGLSGKCSIVEDGLMVQILPKKMATIQQSLKTMKDIDILCGPVDGDESQTELVSIQWVDNDINFNVGVISPIDKKPMDGIPSIRVHHGSDFANLNHIIRWTEVFILKSDDESAHGKDPIDLSKLSEQIARSASMALVSFLDLLATNGMTKIAIRATLDQDQVCYEAGSNFDKLAPLYMNALDNELIPTLHRQATNLQLDQTISLELIFHIMDV